jgi:hypothetical protein
LWRGGEINSTSREFWLVRAFYTPQARLHTYSWNTSLLALAACGGGGETPAPALSTNDTGDVAVKHSSVLLTPVADGVGLTMFRLDGARAAGALADIPASDPDDLVVETLRSVTVEDGNFVFAALGDFASGGAFENVIVNGSLWLQSGSDGSAPDQTIILVASLSGHDLIFDMPSDDYSIILDAGSVIILDGGRIIVSDGTLDVTAAHLVQVEDIILNSALTISVQQLADLGGTVSSGGSGVLKIALADMTEAELLQQILADKTLPSGLTLALEAKTPEVAAFVDKVLLPEIKETLAFEGAEAVAGENDAPSDIDVTLNEFPENVRDLIVATVSVVDVDPRDTHTIKLSDDRFIVVGDEIVLAEGISLDFEAESVIELVLTATDAGGLSVDRLIELQVVDINEAPTSITVNALGIPENTAGAVVATLTVIDPDIGDTHSITLSDDRFVVVGSQVTLAAGVTFDFETESAVTLTITAVDNGGLSISETATLDVADANDAPTTIDATIYDILENARGVLVADALVDDPDAGDSHVITVSDTRFVVSGSQIFLAEGISLNFEAESTVTLTITATDAGELSISRDVTLQVVDVNEAPTAIEVDVMGVSENSAGALVGTLDIVDPDQNDTHTITLSDDRFVVEGNQLFLKSGVSLNYEASPQVPLTITATDAGGLWTTRTINVQVLDVNEAPTALSLANTVTTAFENQSLSTRFLVADLIVTDDALGTNTFSLSGADASFFEVLSGQLYLNAGRLPDYSDNPTLDVTVSAFDAALPGSPAVSANLRINLLETNATLTAASSNSVAFNDKDTSNSYTDGDTITLRFSSAVNVSSFTTSDFTVSNGSLGNATLKAVNAVNGSASDFTLTLGSTSTLSSQTGLSVKQYALTDAAGLPNANVISFALPPITSGFNIELNYSGDTSYQSIFQAAASIWESVIIGDIPDVGLIDDVLIYVSVLPIDGLYGILGQAGWTKIRSSEQGWLPYEGIIQFDVADMAWMDPDEILDVAVHEIAHVLGFGTLWATKGLVSGAAYIGAKAVAAYKNLGGSEDFIPLETDGGDGTAYSHWDEDIFGREIMTGYLNSGENYLSAITIGAMEDLGYVVDYSVAEPYTLSASVII